MCVQISYDFDGDGVHERSETFHEHPVHSSSNGTWGNVGSTKKNPSTLVTLKNKILKNAGQGGWEGEGVGYF
jgi:hypothetical protein